MEEDTDTKGRRWRVTYTKHLKQKRKVYHDGFLELTASAHKVRLYDDSENLIESKFMKKDDSVSVDCGKSFTMDAHLVDIADPVHLHSNPTVTPPLAQQNGIERNSFNRKPLRKVPNLMCSDIKAKKEAAPVEASTQGTNSILKEWNVLYTTQLNKKAKTYHDGSLRLVQATGSLTKQITLASEDGQILGGRHLKSSECIESGSECELPGYLVQVYDLRVCQEGCAGNNQRSPSKQFVKSKILMKSIPTTTNGVGYEAKKGQAKSMNSKTGNSTEMEKSTNNKKCVGVARPDGDNHRSPLKQFVKSKALMKNIPTTTNGVDDERKKEQVKGMNPQTGNRMEMEKSTNNKKCVTVTRRDACQIMSILKRPTAVVETEVAQVVKKAKSSSQLIQIGPGEEDLPSAEGIHDSYEKAYQRSLTSPFYMESGTQAKESCSSSSMHNSSSVLSDTTVSVLYEGRCEAVMLDFGKSDGRGSVEPSLADTDNFDFPSFDLGF